MKLEGMDKFEYLPGETVMAKRDTLMRIDFPEADLTSPTQCTALVIDESYLEQQLGRINEYHRERPLEWSLNLDDLVLKNNEQLALISSRMIKVLTSNDPLKQFEAEIILRELILSLIRIQNLKNVQRDFTSNDNRGPMEAIFAHINANLTAEIKIEELCKLVGMSKSSLYRLFTEEFGKSPVQLVLEERMRYACELLSRQPEMKIKEVAYASGFNDPNYFNRTFRKSIGCTPLDYKRQQCF